MHNWVMEWILVIGGLLVDTTCPTCTLHTWGIAQKLNTDWFLILDIYSMTSGTCESAFVTRSFRHWTACTEFSDDLKFSNLSPYLLQTCVVQIYIMRWRNDVITQSTSFAWWFTVSVYQLTQKTWYKWLFLCIQKHVKQGLYYCKLWNCGCFSLEWHQCNSDRESQNHINHNVIKINFIRWCIIYMYFPQKHGNANCWESHPSFHWRTIRIKTTSNNINQMVASCKDLEHRGHMETWPK